MEVSGQLQAQAALPQGKDPGTHWTGGWVGSRAGLDAVEQRKISCPCRESNPAVQPVSIPTELSRILVLYTKGL
jgi:hypothetical protein